MSEENTTTSLLRECYKVLEDIQDDGWIIRGGKSTTIPQLLARMRPIVYSPILYTEHISISFRCTDKRCDTMIHASCTSETSIWAYATCLGCEKRYRVVWKHDNVETFVMAVDEEK